MNFLNTFNRRLLATVLLIGLLPLLIFGILVTQLESSLLKKQASREFIGISSSLSVNIDTYVNDLLTDAAAISLSPEVQSIDSQRQVPYITELFDHYAKFGQLAIIDLDSQILHTAREQELIKIAHIDSFQRAALGEQSWVVAPHLFNPNLLVLHMHTPIYNEAGQITQVLGSPSPFNKLTQLLLDAQASHGGDIEIYIMDQNGRVIVHTDPGVASVNPNYGSYFGLTDDTVLTEMGELNYENDAGVDRFAAYTPVSTLDWTLVIDADAAGLLTPARTTRTLVWAGLFLTIIAAVLASVFLRNRLTEQLDSLRDVFARIRIGDYAARAEVIRDDELGAMATSLNGMLDNTVELIQTRDERDAISHSVHQLLQDVSTVANGDLTTKASITSDVTGEIAQSFNGMVDQLRQIITRVQASSRQVSSAANQIEATAKSLAHNNEQQVEKIDDTSAEIEDMGLSILQVAETARRSTEVGEQARAQAQIGVATVQNSIAGMERIRSQVEETAFRVKELGESSQEIGDIVTVIKSIADRIGILALNASIQASAAGEAGRGFAVVAEEVERLSELSTRAAHEIEDRVTGIQQEMKAAAVSMEGTIEEVDSGADLAADAGQTLREIERVSAELAELTQSISSTTVRQTECSETLTQAISNIANVTKETAVGTKQASASIADLAGLADELRGSVSTFKIGRNGSNGRLPQTKAG